MMSLASIMMLGQFFPLQCCPAAPNFDNPASKKEAQGKQFAELNRSMRVCEITNDHLKLLRKLRLTWLNCEAGAAAVHYDKRYGTSQVYKDMAEAIGFKAPGALNQDEKNRLDRLDAELSDYACAVFLLNARIVPGLYAIKNTLIQDFPDGKFMINEDGAGEMEIPQAKTYQFKLSDEHLKLIRRSNWRSFCIDPKRPYGDMGYFYIDMADALGIELFKSDDGKAILAAGQKEHFDRLHGEMPFALRAFFQYGELPPGKYVCEGYGRWQKLPE